MIERAPRKEPESQSFNRRGLREALFQNTSAGELFALISSSKKTKSRLSAKSDPHCGACRQG